MKRQETLSLIVFKLEKKEYFMKAIKWIAYLIITLFVDTLFNEALYALLKLGKKKEGENA